MNKKELNMGDYPVMRHPNCKEHRCLTCMDDHTKLERYLVDKTGIGREKIDFLGRYHLWLTKQGIEAETEWGWATPETFDPKNIDEFIEVVEVEEKEVSDE